MAPCGTKTKADFQNCERPSFVSSTTYRGTPLLEHSGQKSTGLLLVSSKHGGYVVHPLVSFVKGSHGEDYGPSTPLLGGNWHNDHMSVRPGTFLTA